MRKGVIYLEDFDEPSSTGTPLPEEEVETIAPVFTEEDVSRAREEGYAAGLAAGRALSLSLHEEALRRSLAALEAQIGKVRDEAEALLQTFARRVAETVLGSLAAVLPGLVRRHGADEIIRMISTVIPRLTLESELCLRVEETLIPELRERLRTLGGETAGRLVIEPLGVAEGAPMRALIRWRLGEAELALGRLRERLAKVWLHFGLEGALPSETPVSISGEPVHAE